MPALYTSDDFSQEFADSPRVEADYDGDVTMETTLGHIVFHRAAIVYIPGSGTLILLQKSVDDTWSAYVTSEAEAIGAFWDTIRTATGIPLLAVETREPYAKISPTVRTLSSAAEPTHTLTATPVSPTAIPTPEASPVPTETARPTKIPAKVVLTWHREDSGVCDDLTIDALGIARYGRCGEELHEAPLGPEELSRLSGWLLELAPFEYRQTYEELGDLVIDVRFDGGGNQEVSAGERGIMLLWLTQLYTRLMYPERAH